MTRSKTRYSTLSVSPSSHSQVHPQCRHQAVRVIRIQGSQTQDLQAQLLQDHRLRHLLIGFPRTNGPSKRHLGNRNPRIGRGPTPAKIKGATICRSTQSLVRKNTINHGKRTLAMVSPAVTEDTKNEVLTVA